MFFDYRWKMLSSIYRDLNDIFIKKQTFATMSAEKATKVVELIDQKSQIC